MSPPPDSTNSVQARTQNETKTDSNAPENTQDDRPTDEQILQYEKEIRAEELAKPCIGPLESIVEALVNTDYADSSIPVFARKIESLSNKFKQLRRIKKDGNCFYRALAFRLTELLVTNTNLSQNKDNTWHKFITQKCNETKGLLLSVGYDEWACEDFYDLFMEILTSCKTVDDVQEAFCTEYKSDAVVAFLRLVAAAIMKQQRDLFEPFILDLYPSLDLFISSQVEPVNCEADHPQIIALVNALGIPVSIANLDASISDLNYHEFSPMDSYNGPDMPTINLLFRPGHYDVLYE